MPEFHETVMGNRFYNSTVPRIAEALEKIAEELETMNRNYAHRFGSFTDEPADGDPSESELDDHFFLTKRTKPLQQMDLTDETEKEVSQ